MVSLEVSVNFRFGGGFPGGFVLVTGGLDADATLTAAMSCGLAGAGFTL